ncbi:MAG: hypothetical protein HZA24_01840 [Nitrospirae bacterium]|nr:hypothetical protein [Nitrospirota bacterium]
MKPIYKRLVLGATLTAALAGPAWLAFAEGGMDPYLPPDEIKAMMTMMMTMEPDTLKASVERGKVLFNDTSLGHNKTGQSCASCHPGGNTIGGAADMEWKGMTMKVAIPTLKTAASHFPKPAGPMKAVVDLMGMDNMCIMSFLKGDPLDRNSQAAVDLAAYVTSFASGKKVDPGGAKTVPTPVPGAM